MNSKWRAPVCGAAAGLASSRAVAMVGVLLLWLGGASCTPEGPTPAPDVSQTPVSEAPVSEEEPSTARSPAETTIGQTSSGEEPPAETPKSPETPPSAETPAPPPIAVESDDSLQSDEFDNPPIPAEIDVDRDDKRMTIPCLFANPTQLLEVFACHWSGPVHETVLAFTAEGEALYGACLELGFRPPEFWNATNRGAAGKPDVRYTLGDRAVVFVSWESEGVTHRVPAEKLLVEAASGFSPFVRGFSFGGSKVPMGDPPELRIPPSVEFTVGGPRRGEKAVDSIFFHPHDLAELTAWMEPLEIDDQVVPNLEELVVEAVPAQLIVQKVAGEEDLLSTARDHEKAPRRRAVLERLIPIGRRIDELKNAYAAKVERIRHLLDRGEELERAAGDGDGADEADDGVEVAEPTPPGDGGAEVEEELLEIAAELLQLQRQAEVDVLRVWNRYLEIFLAQEKFRLAEVEASEEIDPELLDQVRARFARFSYEPRIAAAELAAAELVAEDATLSENDRLLLEGHRFEIDRLRHESNVPLARAALKQQRERLADLDRKEDPYLWEVISEHVLEIESDLRFLKAKSAELATRAEESRLRAAGGWNERRDEILERRRRALTGIELAQLEKELKETRSDLRWTGSEIRDDRLDDERKEELRQKLEDLEQRRAELERNIARRKEKLGEAESDPGGE